MNKDQDDDSGCEPESELEVIQKAVAWYRILYKEKPQAFAADLAMLLNGLGIVCSEHNKHAEALKATQEAVDLYYSLYQKKPKVFAAKLAGRLNNLGIVCSKLNKHAEALKATQEAVNLYRSLLQMKLIVFEADIAGSLNNLGNIFSKLNRLEEAIKATQEAVDLYRSLYKKKPKVFAVKLAGSLNNLGNRFREFNSLEDALKVTQEAVDLYRGQHKNQPTVFFADLAGSLNNLGNIFSELYRLEDALKATQEAVDLYRDLYQEQPEAFAADLAMSLNNLGNIFSELNRLKDALKATQEAVDLYRGLYPEQPEAFAADLAMSLNNLGITFSELNRLKDALEATQGAVGLYIHLYEDQPKSFAADLAMSLDNLGTIFDKLYIHGKALKSTQWAVNVYRGLYQEQPEALAADLTGILNNLGHRFSKLNKRANALKATREAVDLCRGLYQKQPKSFASDLAGSMNNLGQRFSELNKFEDALKATQEAVDLYRGLYQKQPGPFAANMALSLNNLGKMFSKLGRSNESKAAWNEAGLILVSQNTMNPIKWCQLLSEISSKLDSAENLRSIHLVAIQRIAKLRRVSYFDSTAGEAFIKLQAVLIADTWNKLEAASQRDSNLMDDAIVILVSAMHSPDLMRWLADNQRNTPEGMALAHAEDEMRQANDALHFLYKRLRDNRGDDDGSPTMGMRKAPTAEQHKAIELQIKAAIEREAASRYCLENAQTALALQDPAFASAYEVPPVSELRFMLENLQTATSPHNPTKAALLCFLELPTNGQQPARLVGVMLTSGKAQVQQIEFPGLWDLAKKFHQYKPLGQRSNATLRLLRDNDDSKKHDTAETLNFDSLFDELKKLWWTPLQAALGDDPVALSGVLHICSHGIAHQLPYSKVSYLELGGNLQLFQFPGLPYLRLAYSQGYAKIPTESTPSTSTNWQIAHNCAWNEAIPLPMVAVEASLLIEIIKKAQQSAEAIEDPKKVVNGKRGLGLVVCSHGTKAQGVNSAVHLTKGPLTTREVMSKKIGPEIALIPACHAADTADDHAHNALGVAAGFLLAGSKVVVGSIKAVPDTLMPWFSTLCVWYVVHEKLGLHAAAVRARQDFGAGEFPANFQTFVKEKLAKALSTLHPGDQEVERLGKPLPTPALLAMLRAWPWCGMNRDALVPRNPVDTANMKAATNAMASKAFTPRDGVAKMMREMAAFLVVFGIG